MRNFIFRLKTATEKKLKIIIYAWSCQQSCETLTCLLNDIHLAFHRQNVGTLMGNSYAPLVADLVLICYERHFIFL